MVSSTSICDCAAGFALTNAAGVSDGIVERLGAIRPSDCQCKGTWIKGTCNCYSFSSECNDTGANFDPFWWMVKSKCDAIVDNNL